MDKEAQEKIVELIQGRLINPAICQEGNKSGICYGAVDIGDECNACMAAQIHASLAELGYRKIKDRPPLLVISSEEADKCRGWAGQRRKFIEEKLEAQREADIKHYEG